MKIIMLQEKIRVLESKVTEEGAEEELAGMYVWEAAIHNNTSYSTRYYWS